MILNPHIIVVAAVGVAIIAVGIAFLLYDRYPAQLEARLNDLPRETHRKLAGIESAVSLSPSVAAQTPLLLPKKTSRWISDNEEVRGSNRGSFRQEFTIQSLTSTS